MLSRRFRVHLLLGLGRLWKTWHNIQAYFCVKMPSCFGISYFYHYSGGSKFMMTQENERKKSIIVFVEIKHATPRPLNSCGSFLLQDEMLLQSTVYLKSSKSLKYADYTHNGPVSRCMAFDVRQLTEETPCSLLYVFMYVYEYRLYVYMCTPCWNSPPLSFTLL